jgi:hypothetical protein
LSASEIVALVTVVTLLAVAVALSLGNCCKETW